MSIKIVVTGASGFIGKALCAKLEEKKDYSIIKVSRSKEQKSNINLVDSYDNTPVGDVLIHLGEDPDRFRVNKIGNAYRLSSGTTMESLLRKGFKKIIYSSSSVVYGDQGEKPYKENMMTYANDIYSRAKLENEERVLSSGGTVIRFSNVIGNEMSKNTVLNKIINQLPKNDSLSIYSIHPIRDFIWIDDGIDAIESLLKKDTSGVFNIGSGVATSIKKLIETVLIINEQNGREIKSKITNPEYSYNVLNVEKIKKITGWKPKYSLSESLKNVK